MSRSRPTLLAFAAAAALSACSFANDTLWPALSGEDPRGAAAPRAAPADTDAPAGGTAGGTAGAPPASGREASASGAAPQLRRDLDRLKNDVALHMGELMSIRHQLDQLANNVDGLADGIDSRLKSRTQPNDPQLVSDFNESQAQLNRASTAVARLNNISNWATTDSVLASYVVQAIRAAANDPNIAEPDRRQLASLEREADRSSNLVDQLVTGASGEIASRNLFISAARRRLTALGPAIASGDRTRIVASGAAASQPSSASGADAGRRALVTIRFDRPNVAYEQELFRAVSEALDRRPDLALDIVAVSPPGRAGDVAAAERNVESVVKSLASMGLPPDRLRLSAATLADAAGNEIRIYPR
jgi:hypothetical protein